MLAPARWAILSVACVTILLIACLLHAVLTERHEHEGTHALIRQHRLSDVALTPHDDLRHPGWGRPEQGRSGQPGLPDPRGTSALFHPVPMKVAP